MLSSPSGVVPAVLHEAPIDDIGEMTLQGAHRRSLQLGFSKATVAFVTKLELCDDLPSSEPGTPKLISPANGARVAQPITFDWTDVADAASYTIKIDNSSTFTTPLVREQSVMASQFTTSNLATVRHWWRVRALNSAGVAGAWSGGLSS